MTIEKQNLTEKRQIQSYQRSKSENLKVLEKSSCGRLKRSETDASAERFDSDDELRYKIESFIAFNCGVDGHWARDCTAGDWKNKCYRCGERGHIERNCKNSPSPKKARQGGSYSRSPVKSRSPRRRRSPSRSRSYSRGRSYSRSRSPVRREKSVEDRSRSPKAMERSVSPKGRDQSLSPDRKVIDASPKRGSDYDGSPKENGNGRNSASPIVGGGESPVGLNGQDRSPIDDEAELSRPSPKGSESP